MSQRTSGGSTSRPVLAAHELRLDAADHSAHLGGEAVRLRPKSFALLRHLMEHPGKLVTKDDLLGAIWPETQVSPSALKVCMREVRQALGDDVEAPRFIGTVGRLGYRFIPLVVSEERGPARQPDQGQDAEEMAPPSSELIGRDHELDLLRGHLTQACAGARQLVFVTGEAGIGKTSLVGAFLGTLQGRVDVRSAMGQCIEHSGLSEAYLPVLEALGELCWQPGGEPVRELLRRYAPTWLLQLPALLEPADHEMLRRDTIGATPERMLREMAEALEALTAEKALLLVLEDLHWSDPATLDLISYLGRRRQPARLLLLGLFRPEDALQQGHTLSGLLQDLRAQRRCTELPLRAFTTGEVVAYLQGRLEAQAPLVELGAAVWRRTQGNPLFVANVVEELAARGRLPAEGAAGPAGWMAEVEQMVPESLRLLLEYRLRRLRPEEQRILEAASVAGEEFTAEAAGAAALMEGVQADEICERLAGLRQFIGIEGLSEWPDGTISGRYRFLHALYREVLLGRVMPARQVQYHHRVAQRLERAYGERADELAGELALHFESAHMPKRAIHYLQRAARILAPRYANREAAAILGHALALLPQVPEAERVDLYLLLREQRGLVYRSMGNIPASLEEFTALANAAEQAGDQGRQARALLYMADQVAWFDTDRCLEVLEQALALSEAAGDEEGRVQTRGYLGYIRATRRGWSDEEADACLAAMRIVRSTGEGALAWPSRAAQILVLRSENQTACSVAQDGLERALRTGDIAEYLTLHYTWSAALFNQGEIGLAIDVELRGVETAEKNEHHLWAGMLRTSLALTYEQSCAFAQARDVAESVLAFAQEDPAARKTLLQTSQCMLGLIYRGLGDPARSLRQLLDLSEAECQDLVVSTTRSYALSECWLTLGEMKRAIGEAERVIKKRASPGERTLIALSRRVCARAAMLEGRWSQAEAEIGEALDVLGGESCMGAWQVLATAAEIHRHEGREEEARRCLSQSAAIIRRMADGLRGHETVRQEFLAYPEVREILAGASR